MTEVQYSRRTATRVPLSDTFFDPELVYSPGKLDQFLVGLATQPSQNYDNIVSEEVTNHLFQAKNSSFGMDLVALNIQRGRDHGLPGYTAWLRWCGLAPASEAVTWAALARWIPDSEARQKLEQVGHLISKNISVDNQKIFVPCTSCTATRIISTPGWGWCWRRGLRGAGWG